MHFPLALVFVACLAASFGFTRPPTGPANPDAPGDRPESFHGHRVVRATVKTQAQLDRLLRITPDVWSESIGVGKLDVRIPPDRMDELERSGIAFEVLIEDVQPLVAAQLDRDPLLGGSWFDDYKTYDEVMSYLDELAALRPDLAQTFTVGSSLHGRDIRGIRITSAEPGTKPQVLLQGCQHAREWIAVMVPMFIADALVRQHDSDPGIQDLLARTEVVVVPIVNPDGYEFTWTDFRFWRKNLRDNGDGTWGVDLNRNWSYGWGGEGSSGDGDSEIYRGPFPFSEPETAAMRDFILAQPNLRAHVDIHSYSQLVLQPWGWTFDHPPDHDLFEALGQDMVDLIFGVHSVTYVHGPCAETLYLADGVAPDYTYGELGVLGFTIELRDDGDFGFLLPPEQITPNGEEILPAVMHLMDVVSTPIPATLDGLTVLRGSLLSGGIADLATSDDVHVRTRSQLGFTAFEPNVTEIRFDATSDVDKPLDLDLAIESRVNNPNGTARVRLRDVNAGGLVNVATYPLGTTDAEHAIDGLDASTFIDADGGIELNVVHVVAATFSAAGFDSYFDFVKIGVQ